MREAALGDAFAADNGVDEGDERGGDQRTRVGEDRIEGHPGVVEMKSMAGVAAAVRVDEDRDDCTAYSYNRNPCRGRRDVGSFSADDFDEDATRRHHLLGYHGQQDPWL